MIDTRDLDSYYPGYDEYCERSENQGENFEEDIDAIIDERRLQELEEKEKSCKKETELLKVVYEQESQDGIFNIVTYHAPFLEEICKRDRSTFIAIKNTVIKSFENIENKVKEEMK